MIVGNAVATIEASTAGMKIAISAAASTRPRRGTNRVAVRASSTIAWSTPRVPDAQNLGKLREAGGGEQCAALHPTPACHPGKRPCEGGPLQYEPASFEMALRASSG